MMEPCFPVSAIDQCSIFCEAFHSVFRIVVVPRHVVVIQEREQFVPILEHPSSIRHRFLSEVVAHQPKGISGILEVDETYFRESQKGARKLTRPSRKRGGKAEGRGRKGKDWVPVLVGRARGQAQTADKVLGRLTGAEVTDALKDAVTPGETILCTDGHSAFLHLQHTLGV